MTTTFESIPTTWDDDRDTPFFRITDGLFPSAVRHGAAALLASYDDFEPAATGSPQPPIGGAADVQTPAAEPGL